MNTIFCVSVLYMDSIFLGVFFLLSSVVLILHLFFQHTWMGSSKVGFRESNDIHNKFPIQDQLSVNVVNNYCVV